MFLLPATQKILTFGLYVSLGPWCLIFAWFFQQNLGCQRLCFLPNNFISFTPSRGWAEMIKKVYEIDPLICPKCGGTMPACAWPHADRRIVSFIEDYNIIDKIIKHLKLTFKAERPPPPQAQLSIAAEERSEYLWNSKVLDQGQGWTLFSLCFL